MAIGSLLDPILNPVLALHPFWAIVLMSFVIALAMTLVYKWMTNQEQMKEMKERIKGFQKKMKELRDKPDEMMKIQKQAMEVNMKYMSHSMKPTLISFIPIILIFGWMHAHLAYEPILPGQEFSVEASFTEGVLGNASIKVPEGFGVDEEVKEIEETEEKKFFGVSKRYTAEWRVTAPEELTNPEGDSYILEFEKNDEVVGKEILVTYNQMYKEPVKNFRDSNFNTITVGNNPIRPMGNISILGWRPGWLGVYIIFSIIFSMSMRRILKLH
ncbi:DUF106 domain-containing protein [Candidatus Woesearchaeota archaeon]|nr:DUF106 domain-containing protein [Candidatus Woesearchaeota archaeon]